MTRANSASFTKDLGRMLENLVFLRLRKKYPDIYYYKGKGECDFVIREKGQIMKTFQVCYKINETNKEREIGGLLEAMEKFDLKEGKIISFEQEDSLVLEGKKIEIVPAWKWMLSQIG